jgi:hypothetical protein
MTKRNQFPETDHIETAIDKLSSLYSVLCVVGDSSETAIMMQHTLRIMCRQNESLLLKIFMNFLWDIVCPDITSKEILNNRQNVLHIYIASSDILPVYSLHIHLYASLSCDDDYLDVFDGVASVVR